MFGKYGEITDIKLPYDAKLREIKGYALVTFMFPEHALQAYTELDGQVFHVRYSFNLFFS